MAEDLCFKDIWSQQNKEFFYKVFEIRFL